MMIAERFCDMIDVRTNRKEKITAESTVILRKRGCVPASAFEMRGEHCLSTKKREGFG